MAGGVMPAGHFLVSAAANNPIEMFEVSATEEEYLFALNTEIATR
jgi:hypothetical protein